MEPQPDIVMMNNGKMLVRRHGRLEPMDMVMTLSNGTRVALDGSVTLPDGTSRMLMDGEALTLDGEPTTAVDMNERDELDD